MTRRLSLLFVLAFGAAALSLPGTVAAGPGAKYKSDSSGFTYKKKYNHCKGADPHLKIKNVAKGFTKANKLTTETWVERKPGGKNQKWKKVYTWSVATFKFKANGDRHWLTSWRTWKGSKKYWFRIGFRLNAWQGKKLLATTVVYGKKC